MSDPIQAWSDRIRAAAAEGGGLRWRGGGSKDFYGRQPVGDIIDTTCYAGIVSYEPSELVVTVRAGTRLADLEAELARRGQMLAFEPPHFSAVSTVGGCVAAGLAGPRRAAVGGVRDFVLGARLIDGRGQVLKFGGEVMKNVAGYDVSRLLAGSLGTLGLIVEVSLKVLPRPAAEASLRFEMDQASALQRLNQWAGQALPISASLWRQGVLDVRLSGAEAAVQAAAVRLGGERLEDAAAERLWAKVRDQQEDFFHADFPLWRLSLPSDAPVLALPGEQWLEWGGAQRWLRSPAAAAEIRSAVAAVGGHATVFRGGDRDGEVFQPLPAAMLAIQRNLKRVFDPAGIACPGRLYAEL